MNTIGVDNKYVNLNVLKKDTTHLKKEGLTNPISQSMPVMTKPTFQHLKANFIPFLGSAEIAEKKLNTNEVDDIIMYFDKEAENYWNGALDLAQKAGCAEVSSLHYLKAAILDAQEKLTRGSKKLTSVLSTVDKINNKVLGNELNELALELEFEELISALDKKIEKLPKAQNGPSQVSSEFVNCLRAAQTASMHNWDGFNNSISAESIFIAAGLEENKNSPSQKLISQFLHKVKNLEATAAELSKPVPPKGSSSNAGALMKAPKIKFDKAETELNVYAQHARLYNFKHLEHKAAVVANLVTSGKNANFVYQKGAKPEYLAHSFASMLAQGKFKDLNPENTQTFLWDMNKMVFAQGGEIVNKINQMARESQNDGKHRVIFVKDFNIMLILKGLEPSIFFNADKLGDKLHIIGFTEDEVLKEMTEPVMGKKKAMELRWQHAFEEISLLPPSPKQAKEMLLSDSRLLGEVVDDYPGSINVDQAAVEKVVDIAATSRKGALPGKAMDLLDLVIGSKLNNEKVVRKITENDITTYLKNYPEFAQSVKSASESFDLITDTGIKMKDVGGAAQAKDVVQELLDFIKQPEKFEATNCKMPKGILLSGSPGNGKTYLAKAIAGEAKVPFISVSGSQFVEKYVGVGASRVRDLFDFARQQARALAEPGKKGTAIIFIDEFDALGRARGKGGNDGGSREAEQTLNQLLVEMDGLKGNEDVNIVVLAATNRPDLLDEALTERPGRFDYKIEVPNPANDKQARYEILSIHARKKEFNGDREQILKEMADRTSGSSGARLADIINKASIIAAKDGRSKLTINDLVEAKLESLAGRVTRLNTPDWYNEMTVAHECGHALVKQTMLNLMEKAWQKSSEIDTITTDPRGNYAGAVWSKPGENPSHSFESVFSELASMFGGYSVEKQLYGMKGSNGISQDLKMATNLTKRAISEWGMGPNTGIMSLAGDTGVNTLMNQELKKDMQLMLKNACLASDLIVQFHKDFISSYVDKYKTNAGKGGNNLSGDEFQKMLNDWLKTDEGKAKFAELQENILTLVKSTQNGQEWEKPKSEEELKKYIL